MTRGEIASRISAGINDPEQVFMTPDELALSIDEASQCMAEDLGAVRRTVFVAQRPGTTYYHLHGIGEDLIAPFRIWDHVREFRLTATSLPELDARMRNWPTASRDPIAWFPISWDLFGIWPRSSEGGGILRIDCVAWPRSLMDDGDEPELLAGDQDALVAYGTYEGLVKRWDAQRAVSAYADYTARRGGATAKGGTGLQAKSWQRSEAGNVGLRSGLERL